MKIIKRTKDTMSQIYLDALFIRHEVFVKEQQVPIALEIDEQEAKAIHFVLYENEEALATLRLLPLGNHEVKLQRMAVLPAHRQRHFGKDLIVAAQDFAKEQGFNKIKLGAQTTAIPFYEHLGFVPEGEEFLDAGIPHRAMSKNIINKEDWF
ncbi:GNAT family N-acetyltransferase [Enterococcus lemanii]|jgi:predicted GNAT family N-acyltransferase|uniref:GNAT family N-acetyltransferase n=1 Tax=Enterococcus lemanii TaxID=1159752 RepID=A0ABV9MW29_9ENTE|nr:GNAT family N-acetyltransferase [Enterococcus lemanii]MBM7708301.1 putative GNAT family N-acyltransferase [Enterococcus lemanii]NLM67669.1 GNAT family N-acetyltransferase [Enterococcus sp.]